MSRYYGGWGRYIPVAERRKKAEREMNKLRKKGIPVDPVVITGRAIASTFWGKAWCKNLESYHDFENRIPRGRTYVRNGSVVDLQIGTKEVRAMVSGSSIYKVKVIIGALPQAAWRDICNDCSVGIDSLVELLQGRFNKGVMDRLCRQDSGLFPKPSEIKFSCSCPDYASMCKHIAAALYGIGARLDEKPELLFLLRSVDHNDLLAHVDTGVPLSKEGPKAGTLLETDDISQIFGLDMVEEDLGSAEEAPPSVVKTPSKLIATKPTKQRAKTEQEEKIWQEIEVLISGRAASGYTKAAAQLISMRDNAQKAKKIETFNQRLEAIRVRHKRKTRFIQELNAAVELSLGESKARSSEKDVQLEQKSEETKKKVYSQILELAKSAGFKTVEEFIDFQKENSTRNNKEIKLPPRYQSKDGKKTWNGRGRKPNWVNEHLEGGGKLDTLEIA